MRRTVEQSRHHIVNVASQLISEYGPDGTSLRQIATAAEIAPGLITYHFGSYESLVRAVLQEDTRRLRERVAERIAARDGVPLASDLAEELFDVVSDRTHLRLWAWAMLNPGLDDSPAGGLTRFVDELEQAIDAVSGPDAQADRERLELATLVGLALAYGHALGGSTWVRGLGREDGDDRDVDIRAATSSIMAALVQGVIRGNESEETT